MSPRRRKSEPVDEKNEPDEEEMWSNLRRLLCWRLTCGEDFSEIKPSGHICDIKCIILAHIMVHMFRCKTIFFKFGWICLVNFKIYPICFPIFIQNLLFMGCDLIIISLVRILGKKMFYQNFFVNNFCQLFGEKNFSFTQIFCSKRIVVKKYFVVILWSFFLVMGRVCKVIMDDDFKGIHKIPGFSIPCSFNHILATIYWSEVVMYSKQTVGFLHPKNAVCSILTIL